MARSSNYVKRRVKVANGSVVSVGDGAGGKYVAIETIKCAKNVDKAALVAFDAHAVIMRSAPSVFLVVAGR